MSLTVNSAGGGNKSQRIASQRKILDEAARRRRARKGIDLTQLNIFPALSQLID